MRIRQNANCSIAIRSIGEDIKNADGKIIRVDHEASTLDVKGHPTNYEFLEGTVFDVNEATGKALLGMKVYSDGKTTDPLGNLIPEGTLLSDFEEI